MLRDISQPQKTEAVRFHLHKMLGVAEIIETGSRAVVAGAGGREEWGATA